MNNHQRNKLYNDIVTLFEKDQTLTTALMLLIYDYCMDEATTNDAKVEKAQFELYYM